MIVSDCPAQKNLIEKHRCGLVFEDQNPLDFADRVLRLYEDSSLRLELGKNGQSAVHDQLHWERTSQELISIYEKIEKRRAPV